MRGIRQRIGWKVIVLGALLFDAAWMGPLRGASPPERVNYQGVLRDATDHPQSGLYDMVFRIWDAPTAGGEVLVDSHLAAGSGAVGVTGGLFNVAVGSGIVTDGEGPGTYTSLADAFRDHGSLYLEVSVNGETLAPRVTVNSVPYSLHAHALDGRSASEFLDVSAAPQTKSGPLTLGGSLTVSPSPTTVTAIVVPFGNVGIGTTAPVATLDVSGSIRTDAPLVVTVAEGTPPFSVTATALVSNLNADLLDGLSAEALAPATHAHTEYVTRTGDTMTGTLSLPDDGLVVGTSEPQLVVLGNSVGIGTPPQPAVRLTVQATPASGSGEEVLRLAVGDAPTAVLKVENASPLDGVFAPRLAGIAAVTLTGLSVSGTVELDLGSEPALVFEASTLSGDAIAVRPLVQYRNLDTALMTLDAAGQLGIGTTTPGAKLDVSGSIRTDAPLVVTVEQGTPPFSVTSTAIVDNLNADLLDGLSAEALAPATHAHTEYVTRTGDTMTGTLSLPDDGLIVGTSEPQLVVLGNNVGIGTPPQPTVRLTVQATPASGSGEEVLRLAVADAPTAALRFENASPLDGVFAPRLTSTATVTRTALGVLGMVEDDLGTEPVVVFGASTLAGDAIAVRPLVQYRNLDTALMTLDAAGQLGIGTTTPGAKLDVSGSIRTDAPLVVTVEQGTPPFSVTSTAIVDNLNADLLDGLSAEALAPATHAHTEYVTRTGDTMTGTLSLPDDGLVVGTSEPQLVVLGNSVGIGTPPQPAVRLTVQATPASGSGEEVLRLAVGDAPTAVLRVENASPLDGVFAPRLAGVGSVTVTAVSVSGTVEVDLGTEPALVFETSTLSGDAVAVRPLVQYRNLDLPLVTLDAAGQLGIGTTTPGAKLDVSGGSIRTDGPLLVTVEQGTPPFSVTSTAIVANLNADLLDGLSAENLAVATHDHLQYVNRTGDTMSGLLALPNDGLRVGTTQPQLVIAAGNVGIGTEDLPVFDLQTEGDRGGSFFNAVTGARAFVAGGGDPYPGWGVEAAGTFNFLLGIGGGGIFRDDLTGNYAAVGQNFHKITGPGNVSFVQNHPYEKDKVIVYAAPEGDETAVYTRGTARLVNGEARVVLGETFQWVTNPDIGLTAYVTPREEAVPLAVVSLTPQELLVRAPAGGPDSVVFDYIVYGLRIGFEETGVVEQKRQEAYIPSMANQEALYAERPELRAFNALERFKAAESLAKGIDVATLDQGRAALLEAAIGEYDPEVHGTGEQTHWPAPDQPGESAAGPVSGLAGSNFDSNPGASGGHEQDVYARSFRPSAPDLAGFVAVSEPVSTGDVLVADRLEPGVMKLADSEADPAVVGIVSGEPGVALGADPARVGEADTLLAQQLEEAQARGDEAEASRLWSALEAQFHATQAPVAFTGIVACKVDASYGAIQVGDLLTTSPTRGHAMSADDPPPGTVLGKALEPLPEGTGLIRVLVMLR